MSANVNATMVCSECSHQSTFPKQYISMGTRKSATAYCGNCGTVTLHNIVPEASPNDPNASGGANMTISDQSLGSPSGGVNRFRYDQSQGRGQDDDGELSSDDLWRKLLKQLADSAVPVADLFRCDDTTRMRMFGALGFEKYEQDRLLILSKERDPKNFVPAGANPAGAQGPNAIPPPSAPASPQGARGKGVRGLNSPPTTGLNASNVNDSTATNNNSYGLYGNQAPPLSNNNAYSRSNVTYGGWRPSGNAQGGASGGQAGGNGHVAFSNRAPSIPGMYMQGEAMVARCTVYPDLPAEFWCCACNCLVSSRCHVQGIHKDHPFISMRLAAETYVRDTTAWADRCRTQLNIANTIIGNLQHAHGILDQSVNHQFEALDKNVDQMIKDICAWRDQLKSDVIQQVMAEHKGVEQALLQAQELHGQYTGYLKEAEPLLGNMPPANQHDSSSDDWALKFLDFVSRLKQASADPITMPKILVPEVRCTFALPMVMDMLKHVSNPISIRLPDIIDPGYFHFPHPTTSTRTPFTLTLPQDGRQRGVVVENGRTLTRAPETAPSHTLVAGSQIFYSGTTSWEVHIDRVGHGVGRILAGVVIQGSDGEGVVWDGYRIVGPNEGESRTISEKFKIKPGTILRFVLELDAPNCFLNCFFEKEGVARIPLPPASSGWVPAFSVFGPQDQITVVPTQGAGAMEGNIPKTTGTHPAVTQQAPQSDLLTRAKLEQQELMIASLQKQVEALSSHIQQPPALAGGLGGRPGVGPSLGIAPPMAAVATPAGAGISPRPTSLQPTQSARSQPTLVTPSLPTDGSALYANMPSRGQDGGVGYGPAGSMAADGSAGLPGGGASVSRTASGALGQRGSARGAASQYSPELAQLLKFVDNIK